MKVMLTMDSQRRLVNCVHVMLWPTFTIRKHFGDVEGLIWDRITAIVTCYSKRFGEGAEISATDSDYLSFEHHRVDVYRHDKNDQV